MAYKHTRNDKLILLFGNRVRELRELKGISQHELARRCELEHSQISRIELGKTNTSISNAYLIVEHLGVTLTELFDIKMK